MNNNEIQILIDEVRNETAIGANTKERIANVFEEINNNTLPSISITKTEIDTLISTNSLVVGTLYEITGVHPTLYDDGTTPGTTIYLQAITDNKLATQGYGIFYNPLYDKEVSGFGIWSNYMNGTFSNVVGNFDYLNKEPITANNGATGLLLAEGFIQWVSGDWSVSTSISGDISSATADVVDFESPSYEIDEKVIWGGYSWSNTVGSCGTAIDILNLDENWSKDVYDETNYNKVVDLIEYDIENDWISRRSNKNGIDVEFTYDTNAVLFYASGISTISYIQFGNGGVNVFLGGSFNNIIKNAFIEDVNFTGFINNNNIYKPFSVFGSNTYSYNSQNFNNTYMQGANVMGNIYAKETYDGFNIYQPNCQYVNNIHSSYMNNNNNIYGQGCEVSSNVYNTYSSNSNNIYLQTAIVSNCVFPANMAFRNNTIEQATQINGVDFSSATLVYEDFTKTIYKRPDGTTKIRYYNDADILVITDVND